MANYVTGTSDKTKAQAKKYALLGLIPFLNGLPYFYVGRIGKGIVYTVTWGWCWVGSCITLYKICMGTFRDNVGAPLRE